MDDMGQLMLERQEQLEESLQRAESGAAKKSDWDIIKFECGITSGVKHELNSDSRVW